MSAEATAAPAPEHAAVQLDVVATEPPHAKSSSPKPTMGLHSPPDSDKLKLDGSDSELSDLEDPEPDPTLDHLQQPSQPSEPVETAHDAAPDDNHKVEPDAEPEPVEDIGEVLPDHWSGTVPVFKPDMRQFKDFKLFMEKIDHYGMKSGIVKIIPPADWKEKLPDYHELVKQIRVREPIKQDIMGSNGTYRQMNILHQRSYNLPQWRQLCDQSEHQPPARRGERRANADKAKPATRSKPASSSGAPSASKGRSGRATRGRGRKAKNAVGQERPMTPISPKPGEDIMESVEQDDPDASMDVDEEDAPRAPGRMGGARQPKPQTQSTSARRKYSRREASARIDEEAFKDWDYNMDISDYTPERCEELERIYWKTLTYAPPLYGADLLGTLFSEDTEMWNLNKLPNLLDVLGSKIPGVNTAYLYLGMWKATFAWHLEDVDLYSINYLHFGAPKQWYSISQGDARRFETAMKSIWPTDAKACDQFLRHKAFLISPSHLQSHFNIKVNKVVSYPGEFVVTYPYGYHSGYNLGYNCAEAVNFALDSWLPMGRIAKKCECAQAQDSVWIDVHEIDRKLRGESTDYEETEDEEEDDEDDEVDDEQDTSQMSSTIRIKQPNRKRKRIAVDKGDRQTKKIRLRVRVKTQIEPPCCLCPNTVLDAVLLPTDDGRKAHRMCALYGPETWIETVDGQEIVTNVANISKARLELKCLYCRSKRGACFQCSYRKCARSYHATCAAAAGVFVEEGEVPIFGEDGTEYKEQAFEFSCRFHRSKRDKKLDGEALDDCKKIHDAAASLKQGEIAQFQLYRGDIFAGVVVENRTDEQTVLIEVIPNGCAQDKHLSVRKMPLIVASDRVEVEWKWLLVPEPSDFRLQKASPNAIPMPTSRQAKEKINATKRAAEELPRAQDDFVDGFTWAEFHTAKNPTNKAQVKVDFSKEMQIWHYLGRTSTEARAQYTDDVAKQVHNSKSNFLDTIPRPPAPVVTRPWPVPYNTPAKVDRPYQYKPKTPVVPEYSPYHNQQQSSNQFFVSPHHGTQPQTYSGQPYTAQQFAPNTLAAKPFPSSTSTFAPQPGQGAFYANQSTPKTLPRQPQATPNTAPQQSQHRPGVLSQSTPRSTQPQKSSTPHSAPAHSRNKSLPFGTDPRYRTSSTYGSARYDKGSSSPFSYGIMQPPGLGATPSPQNGQVFQAQARERSSSAASAMSMPMTSSVIGPSASTSLGSGGQPQVVKLPIPPRPQPPPPSVVQKYAYFQAHHNRDSTKYRTPYAPWGGFTNGYEGNLRAHLMKTPDALFSYKQSPAIQPSATQTPPLHNSANAQGVSTVAVDRMSHTPQHDAPARQLSSPAVAPAQVTPGPQTPSSGGSNILQTASGPYDPESVLTKLHPAIRAQYAAMLQRKQAEEQMQAPAIAQGYTQNSPPSSVSAELQSAQQDNVQHSRSGSISGFPRTSYEHQAQHYTPSPQSSVQHTYQASGDAYQNPPVASHHAVDMGPSVETSKQPIKQQTPIPEQRPVPATPVAQPRPVVIKQTPVPPPRPWEQLQRTTPKSSPALPVSPPAATTTPATTTANVESKVLDPVPDSGPQPINSQPAEQLRSIPVHQLSVDTNQEPESPHALGQTFPEVPAGSFDLVEEIIRNAKRASGSDFAHL